MSRPLVVKAGTTTREQNIYGFRTLTGPKGAKVRIDEGREESLDGILRSMPAPGFRPFRSLVFTAGARDLLVELSDSASEEFESSATFAPNGVPGWELVSDEAFALTLNGATRVGGVLDLSAFSAIAAYCDFVSTDYVGVNQALTNFTNFFAVNPEGAAVVGALDAAPFGEGVQFGSGVVPDVALWLFGVGMADVGVIAKVVRRAGMSLFAKTRVVTQNIVGSETKVVNLRWRVYGFR